ncbi:hypothetical protein CWE09_05205 [Aliidiomarina minuta]|uniref:Uncharacterized protein n=1 Tax=Aliidiomarina minuta TaxID=880057 RepID=A0A432W7U1_9GAMM|nr:OadG family protein [Aliidiomarina minuta]RUO26125.1 hypothetical protein CWE09_05205 [Aliidiomarina minuta]
MNSLFADAGNLMLIGMFTVFCFLLVLTACVSALTHFTAEAPVAAETPAASSSGQPSSEQLAVISSAVQQYRKSKQ